MGTAVLAAALVGCGSASGGLTPGALGVSARDAFVEARSVARAWSPDARLRWVEGDAIDTDGRALPETGAWTFHYTAPGQTRALVVRVTPLETGSEEQLPASPPGYVIGDRGLDPSWIDSREALDAVEAAAGAPDGPVSLLLVPTRPPQWVVRGESGGERWSVHAETGEVRVP